MRRRYTRPARRDVAATVRDSTPHPDGPAHRPTEREDTRGCEPCFQSRTGTASSRWHATSLALDVEVYATDGTREVLAARRRGRRDPCRS